MGTDVFARASAAISGAKICRPMGRISSVSDSVIQVAGLSDAARLGDRVTIQHAGNRTQAEVVRIDPNGVSLLPDDPMDGATVGDPVRLNGTPNFAPDASWIGRVIDPDGMPLDGHPILHGLTTKSIRAPAPTAYTRRGLGARLSTGYILFDTVLPITRGQRIGLFAGSGVGKSTLLAGLARGMEADIAVIALVGERGREVREFVEKTLGPEGLARSIVVAATSDRGPQIRRRCALAATTIAEHFRDEGRQVLLFVDSLTRFAEAHREVAVAAGESPALRGFPASTAAAIASLCERAGPASGDQGDITAIYSVLVAGSDMEEPVADMVRGVLDGHVVMERSIAEAGRYPAVDVLRSVSRSLPDAANPTENAIISEVRNLMGTYAQSELMIRSGLYVAGSDPLLDRAIAVKDRIDAVFSRMNDAGAETAFAALKAAIA